MSTLFGGDGTTGVPIQDVGSLLDFFRSGEKPRIAFGIGIEYERLPLSRETGLAVPYAARRGAPSVEAFLEEMEARHGWRAEREQGRVIAMERGGTRLTLEPGAQVELSGRIHRDLDSARRELEGFVGESDLVAASLGFAFVGLGYHPFSEAASIEWVPKSRYRIMAPYLGSRGPLAHGMMKGTAGCQLNLDFESEGDAMEKLRVAMGISTIVTAIFANSPLVAGAPNGFATYRSHIWMHTDPDRCGLLRFALEEGARYADYADYALDVPMLFVVRDGRWIDMTGRTFRRFLDEGHGGLTPLAADWEMHLTTLFPEARLKRYVEVRGSDSGAPDLILAQAALWKGLLYDDASRRRAWDLVSGVPFDERLAFHRQVVREGLRARLRGTPALELAAEIVRIARDGLRPAEAAMLEPAAVITGGPGRTPAEVTLDRWSGAWRGDPRRLVEALSGSTPAPG